MSWHPALISFALALTAIGLIAGCSEEQCLNLPCVGPRPPVTLNVVDAADGGPVANPVANGIPCGTSSVCIPVQADGGSIGTGTTTIDLTAPGYGHAQVVVTVPAATPAACSCEPDYLPQTGAVVLTHL